MDIKTTRISDLPPEYREKTIAELMDEFTEVVTTTKKKRQEKQTEDNAGGSQ